MVMFVAKSLRRLDILWPIDFIYQLTMHGTACFKLDELTIRAVEMKKRYCVQITMLLGLSLYSWLGSWISVGFHPQVIKIVVGQRIPFRKLVEHWLRCNPDSPTGCTGCLKVFLSLKVPMNLHPALPDFQLQFGQSCTLPFVKPSQFGLLGLEEWDVSLTDSGKVVRKAVMIGLRPDIERNHFSSDNTDLSFVTHFDASNCNSIHSGHLEQLAKACPKLQHLNLRGNSHCLERLQAIVSCKFLRGINLLGISIMDVESYVHLWKMLVDMRLTYLAIELCVLIPWEDDGQNKEEIIDLFKKCFYLKAIEVHGQELCSKCGIDHTQRKHYDLSILSNFHSLVHCIVGDIHSDIEALYSCAGIKYLSISSQQSHFSWDEPSVQNKNLEQLCIKPNKSDCMSIPDTFLQSVSAHGGLVHVVLCGGGFSGGGIIALIENSFNLLTCHIYTDNIRTDFGLRCTMKTFKALLKMKFSLRKLFSQGSFDLCTLKHSSLRDIDSFMVERNMDIVSLWYIM